MNISNQGFSTLLMDNIQRLQSNQLKWMTQMGTGQKFQVPSESPDVSSVLLQFQTEKSSLSQFQKNVAHGRSIAEGAYASIERIQTINAELGAYAVKTSGIDASTLPAMKSTINGFLEQAVTEANSKYLDRYLFSGTKLDTAPFSVTRDADGRITAIQYDGSPSTEEDNEFFIANGIKINPVTDAIENEKILDILNNFLELNNAFHQEPPDVTAIKAAGDNIIKDNENEIVDLMGSIGSKLSKIESADDQNKFLLHDLEGLTSNYADADLAEVIVRLQQSQYAYQAALHTGGKVLSLSLLNYLP